MGATFAGDDRGGVVADARRSAPVPGEIVPPQRRDSGRRGSDRLATASRHRSADLFGDWKAQPEPQVVEHPAGPNRDHIVRETQQIQIALAYPAAPVASPDYYRARAATAILGGYSSARLFTEVREKRGLCYSVYAAYEGQLERAAMLCYAGTSTDRAQQTLDVMLDEIERLGKSGVALDELETMRAGLKSSLIMAQESSMSRSGSLASDWFFLGRVRPIEEIAAELDALSPDAVSDYAATLGKNGKPTILTLGPTPLRLPALSSRSVALVGRCRRHAWILQLLSRLAYRDGRTPCSFNIRRSTMGSKSLLS